MTAPIPDNVCEFSLGEIARATGGTTRADSEVRVRGVSIDTRTIKPGELFVAIVSATGDGHAYLAEAAARGAQAAIVKRGPTDRALRCVEVDDTLEALGRLAHHHLERSRAERSIPLIAIGGAVGKTTTKELTAAAVRARFGSTLATVANFNNLIGVPMTLFTLQREHRAMVIECGTNTRGEIPKLARIVTPDVAMVLNVDIEHSEGLGTLVAIADEEAALFHGARATAITCAEEPLVLARIPARLKKIMFGESESAHARLVARKVVGTGRAQIRIEVGAALVRERKRLSIETELAMLGHASALNAAAALAGAAAMSAEPASRDELQAAAAALATVKPVEGRLATVRIGGVLVIDDSYNANPRSLRAALAAACEVADASRARLLVAFGDMLELGAFSGEAHQQAVRYLLAAQAAPIVAVGPEMTAAVAAVVSGAAARDHIVVAPDSDAAAEIVARLAKPGDVVLVKGSRGLKMERVIDRMREKLDRDS